MRHPIETVLKDGKTVILEDDTSGTYELARWSADEDGWVTKDGKSYRGSPMYWHEIQRAEHPEGECKCSEPLQTATSANLGAEPQPPPASAQNAHPPWEASSALLRFVGLDKPIPRGKAHPTESRRRFAVSCGAAMIAASLTGMYFRGDVAAYAAKHAERSGEFAIGTMPQGLSLEQPRIISLARNPQDAGSAPASAGQVTVGIARTQSPENDKRAVAMENDLFNARQALARAQERETQLKQAAETARRELQQSLDKIATLENELAQPRQHTNQVSLSPRRARRIPQRRATQPNPQGYFGIGG
jgi:hypothetical protein